MSNTADTGQQPRSVVADMAKRSAPEPSAAAGQVTDPKAGQSEQGANGAQQTQSNGAADDLSKLTSEQLIAKLKESDAEKQRARQEADRIANQHKKVLGDWNKLNMKLKTSAERGEVSSKTARELSGMAPGIDPENPFTFLQRENVDKHIAALEAVNPEARFYLSAFMQSLQGMSEDEAEQIAREMLTKDTDAERIALAVVRGKDVLPATKLAMMQRVAKAGDPFKVIEEVEGSASALQAENEALKARLAELEAQAKITVPSRQPLRSSGEPATENAGADSGSDKPLGVQIAERRRARALALTR